MAALKFPVLPVLPVLGNANQPVLPTPPLGEGRNGKREREALPVDLFGLVQMPPRILDRSDAAALVEVLQALRTHPAVAWRVTAATCCASLKNNQRKSNDEQS